MTALALAYAARTLALAAVDHDVRCGHTLWHAGREVPLLAEECVDCTPDPCAVCHDIAPTGCPACSPTEPAVDVEPTPIALAVAA